jgi:hypothetical protein
MIGGRDQSPEPIKPVILCTFPLGIDFNEIKLLKPFL